MESIAKMRQGPSNDVAAVQADIRNMVSSLQEHRLSVTSKLNDLDSKFEAMRRDNTRAVDELEAKLMQLFVLRAEYDPKHQVVLDKIREYDQIIADARHRQEEYAQLKSTVKQLDEDVEHIHTHSAGLAGRIIPWVAVLVSVAALILNYAQHVIIR